MPHIKYYCNFVGENDNSVVFQKENQFNIFINP